MLRNGGGEEARSVRCMCDVCAAHGDRAAVGVDVDAQGSGLREDLPCLGECPFLYHLENMFHIEFSMETSHNPLQDIRDRM